MPTIMATIMASSPFVRAYVPIFEIAKDRQGRKDSEPRNG